MNLHEQAAIQKFRFPTAKGELTLENLYDLPLTSSSGFDLDTVAKRINSELKAQTEESFVAVSNPATAVIEAKLELVKLVIAHKQRLAAERANAAARKAEREKLTDLLSRKQDAALESLSPEEIQKRLDALQ